MLLKNSLQLGAELQQLIITWQVKLIVLGDPGDDVNNQALNLALNEFVKNILEPIGIKIERWPEQGTSQEAQSLLQEYPTYSRDAIAAMLFLQSYLDALVKG
jgi:RNase H-fold protein (predicted Holliday junction resolvase)